MTEHGDIDSNPTFSLDLTLFVDAWVENMATKKLSQKDVATLPNGTYPIADQLFLKVNESASIRSYFVRATIGGKRKDISVGSAKKISLSTAKEKAREILSAIANGTFAKTKETAVTQARSVTFEEIAHKAIDTIEKTKQWRNSQHAHQWRQTVDDYAMPVLGKLKLENIGRNEILEVVEPIWMTKSETATRLLTRLEKIFDWAIFHDIYHKPNPARWKGHLELLLPAKRKVLTRKHHEAMTLDEARRFAQHAIESNHLSHQATLFGLLTACRCGEFIPAKWEEIDMEKRIFSVPPERRKDGKSYPHRVPLCSQAIELLQKIERKSVFIFPGVRAAFMNKETPRTTLKRFLKRDVTAHGCRSTFRDWAAETCQDPVLSEKALMHATGNEVHQAYLRSDLLEARRPLMQAWADELFKSLK